MGLSRQLANATLTVIAFPGAMAGGFSKDNDIRIFATTMAIAKTVKESCTRFAPDDRFLEALRLHLHVGEAYRTAFTPIARAAVDALRQARDEAPSRQAWCGTVFRLYGPDGKLMRGTLRSQ